MDIKLELHIYQSQIKEMDNILNIMQIQSNNPIFNKIIAYY